MGQETVSRHKVVKSLFWAYCESITAQVVSFVVTVVLARLLAPGDYGAIALVTVFINLANVFVNSSFSMSLVQKKDADHLDFNTVFWFNFFLSIILYLVLFFSAPLIGKYYENNLLILVLRVLALRVPVSAYNSIQVAFVSGKMMFRKSFVSTFFGSMLSGVLGMVFAYLGFGLWALVIQSISNVIFHTICLAFIVEWKPKFEFSFERLQGLVGFGWKLLATGFLFTGYSELRSLVIGKRYTADDLGYYNRGCQFPQMIAANIDTTITKVMFPTFSKSQDNLVELKQMTRRAAKTSAYIMTPVLFGMAIVANVLVSLLLTEKWLPCVPYLQIMCIVWWLQPTQSCSIQAVKAMGRSDLYLKIEITSKIIGVSLLAVSVYVFDSPFAIAVSMLVGQILAMLLYGVYVHKYIGYKFYEQILDLMVPAVMSAVMAGVVYVIGTLISGSMISFIFQVMAGAVVYTGISYIFKVEEFHYILNMIREKIGKKEA